MRQVIFFFRQLLHWIEGFILLYNFIHSESLIENASLVFLLPGILDILVFTFLFEIAFSDNEGQLEILLKGIVSLSMMLLLTCNWMISHNSNWAYILDGLSILIIIGYNQIATLVERIYRAGYAHDELAYHYDHEIFGFMLAFSNIGVIQDSAVSCEEERL